MVRRHLECVSDIVESLPGAETNLMGGVPHADKHILHRQSSLLGQTCSQQLGLIETSLLQSCRVKRNRHESIDSKHRPDERRKESGQVRPAIRFTFVFHKMNRVSNPTFVWTDSAHHAHTDRQPTTSARVVLEWHPASPAPGLLEQLRRIRTQVANPLSAKAADRTPLRIEHVHDGTTDLSEQ